MHIYFKIQIIELPRELYPRMASRPEDRLPGGHHVWVSLSVSSSGFVSCSQAGTLPALKIRSETPEDLVRDHRNYAGKMVGGKSETEWGGKSSVNLMQNHFRNSKYFVVQVFEKRKSSKQARGCRIGLVC